MKAGKYNLEIEQGSDYAAQLTLREAVLNADGTIKLQADGTPDRTGPVIDLTGYSFRAQIRKVPGDTLISEFVCVVSNPTGGVVQMSLTAAATKLLTDTEYVYDLEGTVGTIVKRFMQGQVLVSPEVTLDPVVP